MDGIEMIGKVEAINGHDILKRVYSPGGVSPTLSTMGGGNTEPKIMEPYIVASRGRDPQNPNDRTAGNPNLVQRLEPRKDGMTNTITTVQKDNYVAEPLKIRTANTKGYDTATDGDGVDLAYPESKTRRGRVGHGVSKTIMTGESMGVVVAEPTTTRGNEIASTIRASIHKQGSRNLLENVQNGRGYEGVVEDYRIRKLTPKECWRLMGFDDSDFEKAAKVNSNSQLYKQAGNSIVVNVLEGILGNLIERRKHDD